MPDKELSNAIDEFCEKLKGGYSVQTNFFARCLRICRLTHEEWERKNPNADHLFATNPEDERENAHIFGEVNRAIAAFNAGERELCSSILLSLLRDWLTSLVNPNKAGLVSVFISILGKERSLDDADKFRLDLLCAFHDLPPVGFSAEESHAACMRKEHDRLMRHGPLNHIVPTPAPETVLETVAPRDIPDRVAVAERLIQAYKRARNDLRQGRFSSREEDMWSGICRTFLADLIAVAESEDASALADSLMNFGREYSIIGALSTTLDGLYNSFEPKLTALCHFDTMVRLAEALGVLPLPTSEDKTSRKERGLNYQVDMVVDKIEQALSIPISPPTGIIWTTGVKTKKGVFHYRHLGSLYAAVRVQRLNPGNEPVAEYGAGLGIGAFYARRLGMLDYTIYDLPITCLIAGHYLIHATGPDAVCLYGEPLKGDAVKILPFWQSFEAKDDSYRLTLNQDSFPEIAEEISRRYLDEIKRFTRRYFLSINHETVHPRTVHNIIKDFPRYNLLYRQPYWMRKDYVEELFEIERKSVGGGKTVDRSAPT